MIENAISKADSSYFFEDYTKQAKAVLRALESHGFAVAAETNTSMPSAFLNQQILWREALEDARESGDAIALESIRKGLQRTVDSLQDQITRAIDERADWPAAVLAVREWMFVERFSRDLEAAEEALY
jgi:molecular chaperone HscB